MCMGLRSADFLSDVFIFSFYLYISLDSALAANRFDTIWYTNLSRINITLL